MKHDSGHETAVVPGSTKRSIVGGVEYVIRCCDEHEQSFHIQAPGQFTQEELLRLREDHHRIVAEAHNNDKCATEFLASDEARVSEDCGCK